MKHNPKHIQAQKEGKIPYEYLVWEVLADDAHVHKHGGDKYGIRNWRIDEILASTYEGAMMRHFIAWAEGQDLDPDSGKSHLTHLRACCAVVLDAQAHGKMIDDRSRQNTVSRTAVETYPTMPSIDDYAPKCAVDDIPKYESIFKPGDGFGN